MKRIIRDWRRWILIVGDLMAIALSLYLAFATRFWQFNLPADYLYLYWKMLPVVFVVFIFSFFHFGLYHGISRFTGLRDLLAIVKSIFAGTVCFIGITFLIVGFREMPRSIFILFAFYLAFGVGFLRLITRLYRELSGIFGVRRINPNASRTLLLGAGEVGEMVLRGLHQQRDKSFPVGFLDGDPKKQGQMIHGVKVLGTLAELPEILKTFKIDEVIIAISNFSEEKMRRVVETCQKAKVKSRTVPRMADILAGRVRVDLLRPIGPEDLLNRKSVTIENKRVSETFKGKRVMITGAGGSIGSELCRQVSGYQLEELTLVEQNESALFFINNHLRKTFPEVKVNAVVGDICHQRKISRVFDDYQPEIVLHAAAYKHVPMMEGNPDEAIRNNVIGTKILADLALKNRISRFVMLSTDKAVNPVGVMGMTKRLAEIYLQSRQNNGATCFNAVRFGNVLGSVGSVVPIFKQQIDEGGPVTVTHPEIKRFFMTIPEAVELILFASATSKESAVLILEMGGLIKIADLARNMITLAGLRPEKDIKIVYTGLRPGEKMHEELFYQTNEAVMETESLGVKIVQPKQSPDAGRVDQALQNLETAVESLAGADQLRQQLKDVLVELEG